MNVTFQLGRKQDFICFHFKGMGEIPIESFKSSFVFLHGKVLKFNLGSVGCNMLDK